MTFEELQKANKEIKGIDVKGKNYAEVPQRIQAFRKLFPNGSIETEIISLENGVCIMRAKAFDEEANLLGTGTAYEKEDSSFINKTSYIENCETSAVGRALGMIGIGSADSICSAEELANAINNQNYNKDLGEKATEPQIKAIKAICSKHKVKYDDLLKSNNVTEETMTKLIATKLIQSLKAKFGE